MLNRYQRQIILPGFGLGGQEKLRDSSVAIVGLGGLGSPAAMYLARCGVGQVTLIDPDVVSESNLHRQILFEHADIGFFKVDVAARRLLTHQPELAVTKIASRICADNAEAILRGHDVVLDCTDNLAARFALSDACKEFGIPVVYGSVYQFEGRVGVFCANGAACYRCFHPPQQEAIACDSCSDAGVLGVVPGVIGAMQAVEAIKVITGVGTPIWGQLMILDMLSMEPTTLDVTRGEGCCGDVVSEASAFRGIGLNAESQNERVAQEVTAEEALHAPRVETCIFIDARDRAEHVQGAISGGLLFQDLSESEMDDFAPDAHVIIYCQTGKRSKVLAQLLAVKYPQRRISNLVGGMHAWRRLGGPTSTP